MRIRFLFAFAAILWLAAVTGSYYYFGHVPFSPEMAKNLALAGWQIAIAGAILSVSGGLGGRLFPQSYRGTLFGLIPETALGIGILGTAILFVGLSAGFNVWFFAPLLGVLVIFLRREIIEWWRCWQRFPELWRAGGRLGQIIGLGSAILLSFTLFTALAPPLKFDALVYHLPLAKTYLIDERINYQPWLIFWGMPQLAEMLYTWAMALGGTEAAPALGWGLGVLTLVGMLDWGSRRLSLRAGWVAVACLLGGFTMVIALAWGYVDWATMFFGLATLILLDEWRETGKRRTLLLAGLVAGFALGTKYTTGVLAVGGVIVVCFQTWSEGWKQTLKNVALFSFTVILAFLPWLIKNLWFTGNPFYPLLFPTGAMNATRLALYQSLPPFGDWRDAVLLPWRATMLGREGGEAYGASIGPLLLGFGFLGIVGWRRLGVKSPMFPVTVIALTGLIVWAITGRLTALAIQSRLFMTIFPAFALLAGVGFNRLARVELPGVRLGRVAGTVLLLVFGFNILEVSVYSLKQGSLSHLFGLVSTDDYLTANLGMTALAYKMINDLPENSHVLMLWETRSLYCLPRCTPDEIVDRWLSDRAEYGSPNAILASWRATGYTHLLVYHTGADFYRNSPNYHPDDWQTLDELLATLPVQTDLNQIYTLYSLAP